MKPAPTGKLPGQSEYVCQFSMFLEQAEAAQLSIQVRPDPQASVGTQSIAKTAMRAASARRGESQGFVRVPETI
jgi:hypothetical protein